MAEAKGLGAMAPAGPATLDHIVIGARRLDEGVAWAVGRLGVEPSGGGRHPLMGTINALWRLGSAYLEVIAIDPDASPPGRPRWFGLDRAETQARLARGPRLITWVVRPHGPLAAAADCASVAVGPVERHQRADLHWHLTVPGDGVPPLGGLFPGLIEWPEGVAPPPERMAENGLVLERLIAEGADQALAPALERIGAAGLIELRPGSAPGLRAVIGTKAGSIELD